MCGGSEACVGEDVACGPAAGRSEQACLPKSGVCPCPDGLSGACNLTNAFGTCKGAYACSSNVAGACKGTAPAAESCNAIDDNCNGQTDEANATGCKSFFTDADKDTYGTGTAQCLCAASGVVTATKDGDCDDKDANVNPGKPEICGNGKDDNCTLGEADVGGTGCVNYFSDGDGDAAAWNSAAAAAAELDEGGVDGGGEDDG